MKKFILYILLLTGLPVTAQTWTHLGPFNQTGSQFITGRANVVRPDPGFDGVTDKTIYLGGVMGGFWKTVDEGQNWSNIAADQSIVKYGGVSAIAITPDASTIYVADINFQYGSSGIYKYFPSTNQWVSTGSLPYSTDLGLTIHEIKIHPSNPQLIFACTTSGLYRSQDGATTWTKVINNDIQDVAFGPCPVGAGSTYPYYIFAGGKNEFSRSTNDGLSFTTVASMTPVWSPYSSVHCTIDLTNGSTPGSYSIYLFARVETIAPVFTTYNGGSKYTTFHGLFKYNYEISSSSESAFEVLTYAGDHEDYQTDRLALRADANIVYFGGTTLVKYNSLNNNFYEAHNTGNDQLITAPQMVGYFGNSMVHPDIHDLIILPSLNKILLACDGGFFVNNFTPNPSGIYYNMWNFRNRGLNISQVLSFSGSDEDPDLFANIDVDNKSGFINNSGGTFRTIQALEAPAMLIDKFDENNIWYRSSAYSSEVKNSQNQGLTSWGQTNVDLPGGSDFCDVNGNISLGGHEFSLNSLFQDPNRPDHIFYGSTCLSEFCFSDKEFHAKLRPDVVYPSQIDYDQHLIGMAFSRQDKNDVWISLTHSNTHKAQILQFTGSNIDNSWVGIGTNEDQWTIITPDWTQLSHGIVDPQKIWYPGIAASDWTPNKMWAICSVDHDYPATEMPAKVIQYINGIWTDISDGIPLDESPTAIVYEQGSNDHLYLGTNRSLYYYDPAVGYWVDISEGQLPHVMVSQLQINYTENTLRVGLKGRGVWKHGLVCPDDVLFLTGVYTGSLFYEAKIIQNYSYLQNNGDVKMRGANFIEFTPGTGYSEIASGTNNTLLAYIHGCSTSGNTWRQGDGMGDEITFDSIYSAEWNPENINVFPNPTSGNFTLQRNNNEPVDIDVFDLTGQSVIKVANTTDSTILFDLSNEPAGVYLVRVILPNEVKTLQLIKN